MADTDLFGELQPKPKRPAKPKLTTRSRFSWFFALRPAIEDAQRIHARAGILLASHAVSGTRITPDRLHITLEWIGDDIDEDLIERACGAADTIRFPAFDATFAAIKTFPAPSGPCVLLGNQGLDEVRQLRNALVLAMKEAGLKASRSYEPHMTLCYDRVHRVAHTAIEPLAFSAQQFTLVKSYQGQSRHEVMRAWPLGT